MVMDAYSIPQIQDTLDCLQGVVWFILLHLKMWILAGGTRGGLLGSHGLHSRPPQVL